MRPYHSIIHEDRFVAELAAIEPDIRRSDEFLAGVEWIVARNPGHGNQVARSNVFYYVFDFSFERQAIIYYTFNTSHVFFLSIELTEKPEG